MLAMDFDKGVVIGDKCMQRRAFSCEILQVARLARLSCLLLSSKDGEETRVCGCKQGMAGQALEFVQTPEALGRRKLNVAAGPRTQAR